MKTENLSRSSSLLDIEIFTMRLTQWGRTWRLILGTLLLSWAIAGGPIWAYVGVAYLLSGSFGFSFVRLLFRARD